MSVNALFEGDIKHDYASIGHHPNLKKYLEREKEVLKFSCRCVKLKKKFITMRNERLLVLTNKAIYNFRPNDNCKTYRWRVEFDDLVNLVVSKESNQLVIQVMSNKEGYRFEVESCLSAFVETCAAEFKKAAKFDIPIQLTDETDLDKYVRTPAHSPTVAKISKSRANSGNSKARAYSFSQSALETIGPEIWASRKTIKGREGWLSKRKGDTGYWDPKYVVLNRDTLRYYTPKTKGSFSLVNCKVMVKSIVLQTTSEATSTSAKDLPTISEGKKSPKRSSKSEKKLLKEQIYPFDIVIPYRGRKIELAATSKKELEKWNKAFTNFHKESKSEDKMVEGWIWKKNPHDSSKDPWRKRYFMLFGNKCIYYEMVLKSSLNLADGVSASTTKVVRPTQAKEEFVGDIPSETQFSFRFNVNDAGRRYPFAADSRQDMDDWIQSIDEIGKEKSHKKNRSRRGSSIIIKGEFLASLNEKAPEGQVTIVFTGVQGIANLWNDVDGSAIGEGIDLHDGLLRGLLRKFRGYEVKTEGTTFMVAFFTAWEALSWCLAVQEALVTESWPTEFQDQHLTRKVEKDGKVLFNGMRVYMGMQVGKPTGKRAPTTGRMDYYGPCVNKSARVAHAGHGGQILITDDVLNNIKTAQEQDSKILAGDPYAIKDMGKHGLKGIARPTQIYEILPKSLAGRSKTFGHLHTLGQKDSKGHDSKAENKSRGKSEISYMCNSSLSMLAPVMESPIQAPTSITSSSLRTPKHSHAVVIQLDPPPRQDTQPLHVDSASEKSLPREASPASF
mmetsp:Transcript_4137/g.6091  ORF Transcript_4137/g.6091 Transcript_4137/m.6091 type:complete len:785 (-) Transcript_4137:95-2449(-)